MIKTTQNVLPDGYTELEYIESNGNQWIYTNVKLQSTLGFEIKYKYPSDASGVILGFYNPGSVNYYLYTYGRNDALSMQGKYTGGTPNNVQTISLKNKLFTNVFGVQELLNYEDSGYPSNTNVTLFAGKESGQWKTKATIYYCNFYLGDKLVAKFIPCKNASNEVGMYDLVSGTFFINRGTGDFTAGPEYHIPKEVGFIHTKHNGSMANIDHIMTKHNGQMVEVFEQGFTREQEATTFPVTLSHQTVGKNLKQYQIYGDSKQPVAEGDLLEHTVIHVSLADTHGENKIFSGIGAENSSSFVAECEPNKYYKVRLTNPSGFKGTIWRIATVEHALPLDDYTKFYTEPAIYVNRMTGYQEVTFNSGDNAHYLYIQVSVAYSSELNPLLEVTQSPPSPETPVEIISVGDPMVPSEYQEVEYIESSGTQYIDTGFKPNQTTSISINALMETPQRYANVIGGSRNSSRTASFAVLLYKDVFCSSYGTQNNITSSEAYEVNKKYETKLDKNLFYVDGTLLTTHDSQTFQSDYNIYLFGWNDGGTFDADQSLKGNIYSAKIWDNGTIVRDFIPCYRKSDNVIGMYDLVTKTFFTNSGTGTFTKGNDKNHYKIPVNIKTTNLFDIKKSNTLYRNGAVRETKTATGYTLTGASGTANFVIVSFGKVADYDGKTLYSSNISQFVYCDATGGDRITKGSTFTVSTADADGRTDIGIRLNASTTDPSQVFTYDEIQVGFSTPTSYEPYFNETTNIYLDEPLRKIGDYADYVDFKAGKVVRNVAQIRILPDTANWTITPNQTYCLQSVNEFPSNLASTDIKSLSNLFNYNPVHSQISSNLSDGEFGWNTTNKITIKKNSLMTVSSWATWAQANGIYLVYPLATSTEETVTLPAIPTPKGTATIDFDTVLEPSKIKIIYKGK